MFMNSAYSDFERPDQLSSRRMVSFSGRPMVILGKPALTVEFYTKISRQMSEIAQIRFLIVDNELMGFFASSMSCNLLGR